ncbi:hypothetical protein BOQ62_11835 [Chryseobacterium sp. CH21]|uniref:hypothetical protein n=1 Tax=Chryseobacterium sp. CH21 TaxID=713556 RepID=UPI00100BE7D1|nr:hypothetical protein [Chryseobacterium sp. CH21]RXM39361.1 hypothetical protein BOQ62_11835 [Chryseobacterium sp. CH21]
MNLTAANDPNDPVEIKKFLGRYFKQSKASRGSSELIELCENEDHISGTIRGFLVTIKNILDII